MELGLQKGCTKYILLGLGSGWGLRNAYAASIMSDLGHFSLYLGHYRGCVGILPDIIESAHADSIMSGNLILPDIIESAHILPDIIESAHNLK